MSTIIIGILVFGLFIGAAVYMINKKRKNGSVCSCSGCTGCSASCGADKKCT